MTNLEMLIQVAGKIAIGKSLFESRIEVARRKDEPYKDIADTLHYIKMLERSLQAFGMLMMQKESSSLQDALRGILTTSDQILENCVNIITHYTPEGSCFHNVFVPFNKEELAKSVKRAQEESQKLREKRKAQ